MSLLSYKQDTEKLFLFIKITSISNLKFKKAHFNTHIFLTNITLKGKILITEKHRRGSLKISRI